MSTSIDIPVLYRHDPVDGTWTFLMEHPRIIGGPFATRELAEAGAMTSLCSTLHRPFELDREGREVGHLRVTVMHERELASAAA